MLLIGLGAGDLARLMRQRGVHTTAVEIDPAVARAAFAHFGLDRASTDLVLDDGRRFLNRDRSHYDFVVLDAYAGASPASHLFTREAFQRMKARLAPNGVTAVNVVVDSLDHPLVSSVGATLASVFPHVVAVAAGERQNPLNNVIFFASDGELRFPTEWKPAPRTRRRAELLAAFPSKTLHLDARGPIITDDFNPVDTMAVSTEHALRKMSRSALPAAVLQP